MGSNQVMPSCKPSQYGTSSLLHFHHPVNLAYEAATADLNDVNMIDPFHLPNLWKRKTTVNYNRDIEIFPVLKRMLERILGTLIRFSNRHGRQHGWLCHLWTMTLRLKLPNKKSSVAITKPSWEYQLNVSVKEPSRRLIIE